MAIVLHVRLIEHIINEMNFFLSFIIHIPCYRYSKYAIHYYVFYSLHLGTHIYFKLIITFIKHRELYQYFGVT
jgi:hypothetical protein